MQIRIFCTKIQFFDEGLTQNVPLKMCQKISQKCLTQNVSLKMSQSKRRKKCLTQFTVKNVSLKMSSCQEVKFCQN